MGGVGPPKKWVWHIRRGGGCWKHRWRLSRAFCCVWPLLVQTDAGLCWQPRLFRPVAGDQFALPVSWSVCRDCQLGAVCFRQSFACRVFVRVYVFICSTAVVMSWCVGTPKSSLRDHALQLQKYGPSNLLVFVCSRSMETAPDRTASRYGKTVSLLQCL